MDWNGLSTPHLADACVRLGERPRVAPADLAPLDPAMRVAGPARPVRHFGSVDIFLEAYELATPGEVLVIDNAGRRDEACIGDLTVLEARAAGLSALIVWGLHRDDAELRKIGLPVFSLGTTPVGPLRVDPRSDDALTRARIGAPSVEPGDAVFADADGVLFVAADRLDAAGLPHARYRSLQARQ